MPPRSTGNVRRGLQIVGGAQQRCPGHPKGADTDAGDPQPISPAVEILAWVRRYQSRYADAELLYKRSLAVCKKGLGPDHPDLAVLLNNLADLYRAQGRYADALAPVLRKIGNKRASAWMLSHPLPPRFDTQNNGLMAAKALDDSLDVVQRASETVTAVAINKLAARLSAASNRLAQPVGRDQGASAQAGALHKAIIEAVSK